MGGRNNQKTSEVNEEMIRRIVSEALRDATLVKVVEELKQTLAENTAVIESLKTALEEKDRTISRLNNKIDDLEQYQRRQCLRIFGVKEEQAEDTDKIATDVAGRIGVELSITDIDRSHRIGKKSDKPRPIIVKFISYRKRREVFTNKKNLRGTGVTVREDLTRARHLLLKECITKYGLTNVWTQDGDIIIKLGDRKHRVKCQEDMI